MWQNTSVIDKMYKKLTIQVSLNGLSYVCFDTLTNKPTALQNITIDSFHKNMKIEELFAESFKKYTELQAGYD